MRFRNLNKMVNVLVVLLCMMIMLTACKGGDTESTQGTETSANEVGGSVSGDTTAAETEEPTTEESTTEEPTTEEPTTEEPTTEEPVEYIVWLDAGHGGKKGATSTLDGRIESHDTLRLTLAIQRELEKYDHVTVLMTRTEDVDVANKERPLRANAAGADLFVSIHRNSSVSGEKYGVEGWIDKNDPADSRAAAQMMLDAMEAVGITQNCGVKTGSWDEPDVNYTVIEYAEMPAVLLEVGYLNYARDNELFDTHLDGYGKAIAGAIYDWLTQWVD